FWSTYRKAVEQILTHDEGQVRNQDLSNDKRQLMEREVQATRKSFEAILDPAKHEELRKKGERRFSHKATQAALLIYLYRDEPILHLPYRLLTLLVDIDDLFSTWRHQHATLALRMIGTKLGSYQTAGYSYLRSTVDTRRV